MFIYGNLKDFRVVGISRIGISNIGISMFGISWDTSPVRDGTPHRNLMGHFRFLSLERNYGQSLAFGF